MIKLKLNKKLLVIILLGLVVYANSLFGDFVSDDIDAVIRQKPPLNLLCPNDVINNIINTLSGNKNPIPYHSTSVILHIVASILAFYFIKLFFNDKVALLGACLFMVHPINTEAVCWISARNYVVMLIFIFSIILLYNHATKKD